MIKAIFMCFILCVTMCYAKPLQVDSIEELDPLWETVDAQTLVVFDIDDVIISTVDHFAHPYGYQKFVELTNQALASCNTEEEKEEVMRKASLSQLLAERVIIENKTIEIIKGLQEKGIKVIALTNFPRGKYGVIERAETWRIEYLKQIGVSFGSAFSDKDQIEFSNLFGGMGFPSFEEGILFSNGHSKGKVLRAFFETTGFFPSNVIFIDDLLHHHKNVEEEFRRLEIPLVGVHYLGARTLFTELNQEILSYQFNYLLETENWLSDKQVVNYLQSISE